MVHFFFREKTFFHFDGFEPGEGHDTDPNLFLRFFKKSRQKCESNRSVFSGRRAPFRLVFRDMCRQMLLPGLFGEGNEGFWAAAGGNHRRAVICLRRRDYPAAFAVGFLRE